MVLFVFVFVFVFLRIIRFSIKLQAHSSSTHSRSHTEVSRSCRARPSRLRRVAKSSRQCIHTISSSSIKRRQLVASRQVDKSAPTARPSITRSRPPRRPRPRHPRRRQASIRSISPARQILSRVKYRQAKAKPIRLTPQQTRRTRAIVNISNDNSSCSSRHRRPTT